MAKIMNKLFAFDLIEIYIVGRYSVIFILGNSRPDSQKKLLYAVY